MNFGAIARKQLQFPRPYGCCVTPFRWQLRPPVAIGAVAARLVQARRRPKPRKPPVTEAGGRYGFDYYGPEMIKGQPTSSDEDLRASMNFQDQYTADRPVRAVDARLRSCCR